MVEEKWKQRVESRGWGEGKGRGQVSEAGNEGMSGRGSGRQ